MSEPCCDAADQLDAIRSDVEQMIEVGCTHPSPEAFAYLATLRERQAEQIRGVEAKLARMKYDRDRWRGHAHEAWARLNEVTSCEPRQATVEEIKRYVVDGVWPEGARMHGEGNHFHEAVAQLRTEGLPPPERHAG